MREIRELAGELERKKNLRKKEEKSEREKENRKFLFNERRERSVIKNIFLFSFKLQYAAKNSHVL